MTKTVLSATFALALLVPACAIQPGDEPAASDSDHLLICIGAPAAVLSTPYAPSNSAYSGADAISPATYGGKCTKEFVVETTGTTGQYMPLFAEAVLSTGTQHSGLGCVLSKLVVDAWGGNIVPNPADGSMEVWTHIGSETLNGTWSGGQCFLGATLSVPTPSPYSRIRLGARATTGGASVPVHVRMGTTTPSPN